MLAERGLRQLSPDAALGSAELLPQPAAQLSNGVSTDVVTRPVEFGPGIPEPDDDDLARLVAAGVAC